MGRIGVGLGLVSAVVIGVDMYENGINTGNSIDMGVAALGVVGSMAEYGLFGKAGMMVGPAIMMGVTIYGAVDLRLYWGTGYGLTDRIAYGIDNYNGY